jgi:hypothetical protein
MLRIYAGPFVRATDLLSQLMIASGDQNELKSLDPDLVLHAEALLRDLHAEIAKLDLPSTLISLERLMTRMRPDIPQKSLYNSIVEIRGRLFDDIGGSYLLALSARERGFYEPSEPLFGLAVSGQFPTLQYEIDEAGKCLALERSTAAAFHGIRCMEGGIRGIARCLGIPDPTRASNRTWGKVLGSIKDAIDKKWPDKNARLSGDSEFFDDAYAALAAMQNPWRNSTMHLDQKYTQEEALHIFEVIKGFMKKVASRLDEDGKPLA